MPIRRYADPPFRFSPTPTRRPAHTPFRFSRLPLAHAGGISTGACRNLRIYAHKTWEKTPHPVFVLFKSNLPLEGVLLLIVPYWTCDGGLRGERVPCDYRSFSEFLILAFILLSHLRVVHVLTSFLIATGKSLTDCYCDGLWLCPVACRGKIA